MMREEVIVAIRFATVVVVAMAVFSKLKFSAPTLVGAADQTPAE